MKHVPFFANTKDDTHCFQAALRMVLKYFLPNNSYTWKQLDKITEKKKGMWTWAFKGNIALRNMGFDVWVFNTYDLEKFSQDPKGYLRRKYGEEVAREQILHSDVRQAGLDAKVAVRELTIKKLIPTFTDIERLLGEGRLLICVVNAQKLNRKKGYVGHFVVVWKLTEKMVFLHDPGLPPRKNRRVTRRVFEQAWADPNKNAKGIMAYKL